MRGWTNGIVNFFRLATGTKSCEDENSGETLPFATCVACFCIIGEISDARTCLSVCAPVFNVGLKRWYHIRRRYYKVFCILSTTYK